MWIINISQFAALYDMHSYSHSIVRRKSFIVSAKKDFQLKQHSCQSKTVLIDGREKNPNNIHWYANCFYPEKTHRAENNFLQRLIMENVYIFYCIRKYSGHLAQILTLSTGVLSCRLQSEIPVDFFSFLAMYWTWQTKGGVLR